MHTLRPEPRRLLTHSGSHQLRGREHYIRAIFAMRNDLDNGIDR
jgi:hypothetical protein